MKMKSEKCQPETKQTGTALTRLQLANNVSVKQLQMLENIPKIKCSVYKESLKKKRSAREAVEVTNAWLNTSVHEARLWKAKFLWTFHMATLDQDGEVCQHVTHIKRRLGPQNRRE